MKTLIYTLVLGGLISGAMFSPISGNVKKTTPLISITDVLRAHTEARDYAALSTWLAEGVKLTSLPGGLESDLASFFERKLKVVSDGRSFKRYKADPLGLREQIDLFDGRSAFHTVKENGRQVEETALAGSELAPVEFSIRTFGLVPILRELAEPTTNVTYLETTPRRQDKFLVRGAIGDWTVYCDQQHTICRVEIGDKVIEYADYRSVDGVRLPFFQRVYLNGRLVYEIIFTKIELGRVLPAGYFKRESA
ncbi:MAG TPA: hypothetical protein VFB82_14730 [Blastocatellia bacterium]|nr:hypothetical protein [Blastocatellia bacterium]